MLHSVAECGTNRAASSPQQFRRSLHWWNCPALYFRGFRRPASEMIFPHGFPA